ncbi:MAG: hypothetical protein ACFKPT_14085 [Gloeotrichia echinulata GP01]
MSERTVNSQCLKGIRAMWKFCNEGYILSLLATPNLLFEPEISLEEFSY